MEGLARIWSYLVVVGPIVILIIIAHKLNLTSFNKSDSKTDVFNCMQFFLTSASLLVLLLYWVMIGNKGFLRVNNNKENNTRDVGVTDMISLQWYPCIIWSILLLQSVILIIQKYKRNTNRMMPDEICWNNFYFIMQCLFNIIPSLCIMVGPNSISIIVFLLGLYYCFAKTENCNNNCIISLANGTDYKIWIQNQSTYLPILSIFDILVAWLLFQFLFFATGHRCSFALLSVT